MTSRRIQGSVGALAAALVVGLIAALLFFSAPGRTGAGSGATPTVAPTKGIPTATPLPHNALLQPGSLPVVSASDPSIVYQLGDNALMRSQDGGVSYSSLPLPNTGLSRVDDYSLMVSPLDANHVFISVSGKKNGAGCPEPKSPYPSLTQHGGILASGYVPCSVQMVSVNGGQTWMRANLPSAGSFGGLNNYRALAGAYDDQQYAIQAQGNRLYAAMAFSTMGGSLIDSPGVRLVASDDGGVTWHFIDTSLATPYALICDFGADPHSQVIYAVVGTSPCEDLGSGPIIDLWRSENGGQSWQRLRSMPTLIEDGLFVSAQGALYSFMPYVNPQYPTSHITVSPASIMVSVDGGLHFTSAPSKGLPAKAALWHLYGTLPDGSIIFGAGPQQITPYVAPQILYSWKKGQSAWKPISTEIAAGVGAVVVPKATNGQQGIIVVDIDGNIIPVKLR